MAEQAYTLDKVLQEHKRIFSDSSVYPLSRRWYRENVWGVEELHNLDIDRLVEVNSSLEKGVLWWRQPQTFSTGKVAEEIDNFNQILQNKLGYFKRRLERKGNDISKHPYVAICDNYEKILQQAFASLYKPEEQDVFTALEHLVIEIGKKTSAKKDFSKRYGDKSRRKIKVDLHTDEQVVASAIYSSVIENTSCVIVTPDSDHQRLLAEVQKYIRKRDDLGSVSKALQKYPVQVYFIKDEEKVSCNGNTSSPESFVR